MDMAAIATPVRVVEAIMGWKRVSSGPFWLATAPTEKSFSLGSSRSKVLIGSQVKLYRSVTDLARQSNALSGILSQKTDAHTQLQDFLPDHRKHAHVNTGDLTETPVDETTDADCHAKNLATSAFCAGAFGA